MATTALLALVWTSSALAANLEWSGGNQTQLYSDKNNWLNGIAPTPGDNVFFPANSGQVYFTGDVTVQYLEMAGGTQLVLQNTTCPGGWAPYVVGGVGTQATKCLRVFPQPLDFYSAETACVVQSRGAPQAHLVQIASYDELNAVKRLCRAANTQGNATSSPTVSGCWIGLHIDPSVPHDPLVDDRKNYFTWTVGNGGEEGGGTPGHVAPSLGTRDRAFRDWRRYEPNNRTVSEGSYDRGGEDCVEVVPWDHDPMVAAEGSMNDNGCHLAKPYVCQLVAATQQFAFTAASAKILDGGVVGGQFVVQGRAAITKFNASDGAAVMLLGGVSAPSSVTKYLHLHTGALLQVKGLLRLSTGALVGESLTGTVGTAYGRPRLWDHTGNRTAYASYLLGMQPVVQVSRTGNISVVGATKKKFTATINAAVDVQAGASLIVNDAAVLRLMQGGNLSAATLVVPQATAAVELSGGNAQLFTYDAVDLTLASQAPVVGETNSSDPLHFSYSHTPYGVYRLRVQVAALPAVPSAALKGNAIRAGHTKPVQYSAATALTRCLAYTATAADVAAALNALTLVQARGNASVRSYGSASDPAFNYGFTHRIEMDAPPTSALAKGPLRVTVGCYGWAGSAGCGCAETKVLVPPDAAPFIKCGKKVADRPLPDGVTVSQQLMCALPPTLSVTPISSLSQTTTVGAGRVRVSGGVHRLPPVVKGAVEVVGGTALVANNVMAWGTALVGGTGTLALAGVGWAAWDSLMNVGQAEWTTYRGHRRQLDTAPTFALTLQSFVIGGNGSVYAAAPTSNMTWVNGVWLSGTLGGRATVNVAGTMAMLGGGVRFLRMGVTLHVTTTGVLRWGGGTVSLSEGANVRVDGVMQVYGNYTGSSAGTNLIMGQAELLGLNLVYSAPFFLDDEMLYYQGLFANQSQAATMPMAASNAMPAGNDNNNMTMPSPSMNPPATAADGTPIPSDWAWNVTSSLQIANVLQRWMGSYGGGEQWHGYYDSDLPVDLKGGWYVDPLCGLRCTQVSNVTLGPAATVLVGTNCAQWLSAGSGVRGLPTASPTPAPSANKPTAHRAGPAHNASLTCGTFSVTFVSPVLMYGSAQVVVGNTAGVALMSGGRCAGNATFNTTVQGSVLLGGGTLRMTDGCAIYGHGMLYVTGGRHTAARYTQPTAVIAGGALVWPAADRSFGSNVTFAGGLGLLNTGALSVEPQGVTVSVYVAFVMYNDSLVQFPLTSTSTERAPSDDPITVRDNPNVPDAVGYLEAWNGMLYDGGTLRGKADFYVHRALIMQGDGVKRVQALAALINEDLAQFHVGDVFMRDGGTFVNRGVITSDTTVQTNALSPIGINQGQDDASSQFQMWYAGTDVPLGGTNGVPTDYDQFVTMYHSWDDGEATLNYTAYVAGLGNSMSYYNAPSTVNLDDPLPNYRRQRYRQ